MSLTNLYLELHRRAALTGEDRALDLKGGARIAVRCQDGITTLTISRKIKPLSSVEIETFKRDLGIPASAARYPLEGQGVKAREGMTWHYIAWRFPDPE